MDLEPGTGHLNAIDRCTDHDLHVIDDQRRVHGDRAGLVALVELPPVHAGGSVAKVVLNLSSPDVGVSARPGWRPAM
jgi:hypothetical protein